MFFAVIQLKESNCLLKVGEAILEKDSWLLSHIPSSSNINAFGQ